MVVLALVLLVVGELLVSQKGTCLGCRTGYHQKGGCFGYQFGTKYGELFATFSKWRIFGYKNGTFNAALLRCWYPNRKNYPLLIVFR